MKKEQFEAAKPLIDAIENTSKLMNLQKVEFNSDGSELHGSELLHITQEDAYTSKVRNDGSNYEQPTYRLSRFRDGSGAGIVLTPEEVITLTDCVSEILKARYDKSTKKLESL